MKKALFFDLDETLMLERQSAEMAMCIVCKIAYEKYSIPINKLAESVFDSAGSAWRSSRTIEYCRKVGISSWEGLWSEFPGDVPDLQRLREWKMEYRLVSWTNALRNFGINDVKFAEKLSNTFVETRKQIHQLFPYTESTLEYLKEKYRLGIITNGAIDLQSLKIEKGGLQKYFDCVVISSQYGTKKPNKDIFDIALREIGICRKQAVMIGDSISNDIKGAKNAGMTAIWINRIREQSEEIKPDYEISDLTLLPDLLKRI